MAKLKVGLPLCDGAPRGSCDVACGFWMIILCQCGFISCKTCTLWWGVLIRGQLCKCGGWG